MPFGSQIPDSQVEFAALGVVSLLAGLGAFARLLYGKEDMTWRYTLASIATAICVGLMLYGLLANFTPIGGYLTVSIGIGCGLFTDEALRRARAKFSKEILNDSGEEL